MAFFDTTWYCNFGNGTNTGYYAVTVRPQNTAVAAGVLRRQFTAPAVGSERVFVCIVAGTTANVTDATWTTTRGAKTTDGTVTWQECTGAAAVNGDLTNTPSWTAVLGQAVTLGQIVKRTNGASYWICSTAGTAGGSEPAWANDLAGTTRTDNTVTWTCIGVVGNFTGGQAPHARLTNACATNWFAAGNTVYIASAHAETLTSALNPNPAISTTTVGKVICHNAAAYPPLAANITTGATVSTTTATSMTFTIGGPFYIYGVTFIVGVGQSGAASFTLSTSNGWAYLDACSIQVATTSTSSTITIGAGSYGVVLFNNTTVKFAATGQKIIPTNVQFTWQNTAAVLVSGSSVPTTFMVPSSMAGPILLEALDLSQLSGSLINVSTILTNLLIRDCKLHASATVDTPTGPGSTIQLVRCDSGATAYKSSRYTYEGTETTETSITRIGGAVDPDGQAQSRKIVTTANVQWLRPFVAEFYAIWNPTAGGNVTVSAFGTINSAVLPNNDEIWMEVEYLSAATDPTGKIVNTSKATLLTTAAAVSSDSSSWNGGGSGAGWSPFKLTTTLSAPQPGLTGYLDVRVRAAKASTTYYVDPKIELA